MTIGSPFDFIYVMWPRYFENRRRAAGLRWINIFAPQDVLSSNFLEESKASTLRARKPKSSPKDGQTPCVPGLVPDLNLVYRPTDTGDELGLIDIITLVGLRVHVLYWERGKKSPSNEGSLEKKWSSYGLILAPGGEAGVAAARYRVGLVWRKGKLPGIAQLMGFRCRGEVVCRG